MVKQFLARCLMVALFATGGTRATAVLISFAATDLPDLNLGEDLWQYSWRVSDFTFNANQGFTIFFDRFLYGGIQSPPPAVNAGWDALTVQRDLALNSNGFYDAQALVSAPSLADPFRTSFVWLGSGTPDAQPFAIRDASFATIEFGQTSSVPESSTTFLLVSSLAAFAWAKSRRRSETWKEVTKC